MQVDVPLLLEALGIASEESNTGAEEMWACCPFPEHDEDTPSWSIKNDPSMEKHGSHYCFGCGRGGSPVDLVMEVIDLSGYGAAIAWLKERSLDLDGIVRWESIEFVPKRPGVHQTLEQPYGVRSAYKKWTTNAKRYVASRGITEAQIYRWSIGCIPMGPLAGRIYVPAYDRAGALLSYTARDYTGDAKSRYKEPDGKGMDGAHPGAIFGEEHWPIEMLRSELILNEGAFNAMACERVGARFTGALYGSDLSKEQLLKLKSWKSIVIASDLDTAGNKMARKLLANLARWGNTRRVDFPDKRDPNDLEREDPKLLKELLWPTQ